MRRSKPRLLPAVPPPPSPPPTPPACPQQPPTAVTKLFSSLPRFASPDKNLQHSPDSVHKHAASLVCQRLSAATLKKIGVLFFLERASTQNNSPLTRSILPLPFHFFSHSLTPCFRLPGFLQCCVKKLVVSRLVSRSKKCKRRVKCKRENKGN